MKKILLAVLAGFGSLTASFAQSEVADFLKFGKEDGSKLIGAYIDPYAKTLGIGLNNGWYNSAATHKLFGFDLACSVSGIQIPNSGKTFDVNSLGLQNAKVSDNSSSIAPTAAGDGDGIDLDVYTDPSVSSTYIATLTTPGGSGVDFIPIPMVQATFGVLPHTDLIGRWVPEVKFDIEDDQATVGLWGIGLKHNFKESIPIIRHLPFDASFILGYSKIHGKVGVNFGLDNYSPTIGALLPDYEQDPNQRAETTTDAFKYGLIVSKKLSVITFFASVSGNKSKTNFDLLGRYPVFTATTLAEIMSGNTNPDMDINDPVAVEVKNSYVAVDAGFRLKLAFFSLFGSVASADYVTYNAGLSFGFR